MSDTLPVPNEAVDAPVAPEAKKLGRPPKPKTVPILLYHDVWVPGDELDEKGEPKPVRLRTNVRKLDENGAPIFDAKKGDFIKEYVVHNVPVDIAKILLAEKKGERRDPLPGE